VTTVVTPPSADDLAEVLREATRSRRSIDVVGGGTRSRCGRPAAPADLELHTSALRRVVAHEPEDLTLTVEAGMPAEEAVALAASAGQDWPQAEVRPGSTIGGVLATGASGRRRLRSGAVRDSVLQVVIATGDGRLVTAGGRTVKGVSGFDIPRLAVGSHGTLGVITQVTLKLWPVPVARGWFGAEAGLEERLAMVRAMLTGDARPAAVILTPGRIDVELAGPPDDVVAPAGMVASADPPVPSGMGVVGVGVPPPRLGDLSVLLEDEGFGYEARMGVGTCLVAVADAGQVARVRRWALGLGGHASVLDGPDALRDDPWGPPPPGLALMRRLRDAFDPSGVLNGRLVPWA